MSLSEVLNTALEKIQYISKTETIFGTPIEAGGITLIPVSKVSIGFAAGGTNSDKKGGEGAGTGGGVQITPVAFISVSGDKIQIHKLEKYDPIFSKIVSMAPDVIKKFSSYFDKDKKEKDNEKKNQHETNQT
ncbi:MAG: hypothetical protein JW795_21295 [Chitinivibrionales bacterium]|nr:hypothetical protein [Chitinivibrionales bacterium]